MPDRSAWAAYARGPNHQLRRSHGETSSRALRGHGGLVRRSRSHTFGGDAGSGNQPQNDQTCAAINQAADHSPGAANGEAIGDLLGAFCSP